MSGAAARLAADAVEDDAALERLWWEALAELDLARGGGELTSRVLHAEEPHQALATARADLDCALFLGTLDATPCALAYVRRVARRAAATVLLFYVEPEARDSGVAECVLEAIEQWCVAKAIDNLEVAVLPGSREQKSLLEQAGFVTNLLLMTRRKEMAPRR